MKIAPKTSRDNHGRMTNAGEVGDIYSVPDQLDVNKARAFLRPEEELVSLPDDDAPPSQIEPLNQFLGTRLTFDNPVWRGDPVLTLRALQKLLLGHSLALPESERPECLAALSLVENAVQLRLRWLQMRRSAGELDGEPEEKLKNAKESATAAAGE